MINTNVKNAIKLQMRRTNFANPQGNNPLTWQGPATFPGTDHPVAGKAGISKKITVNHLKNQKALSF
jgi:hypothetical protein